MSVTQLVDFAKCEKLGVLKLNRKESVNAARRQAMDSGIDTHARLEKQAVIDGRCFIASYAFGPGALETCFLRRHRDAVWRAHAGLRFALRCYYWASPLAVRAMRPIPGAKPVARAIVRAYIRAVGG